MENNFAFYYHNTHETFRKPDAAEEAAPMGDPAAGKGHDLVGGGPTSRLFCKLRFPMAAGLSKGRGEGSKFQSISGPSFQAFGMREEAIGKPSAERAVKQRNLLVFGKVFTKEISDMVFKGSGGFSEGTLVVGEFSQGEEVWIEKGGDVRIVHAKGIGDDEGVSDIALLGLDLVASQNIGAERLEDRRGQYVLEQALLKGGANNG